jgi:hypothetical protein
MTLFSIVRFNSDDAYDITLQVYQLDLADILFLYNYKTWTPSTFYALNHHLLLVCAYLPVP